MGVGLSEAMGVGETVGDSVEFSSTWISPGPSSFHSLPFTLTEEVPLPSWSISTLVLVSDVDDVLVLLLAFTLLLILTLVLEACAFAINGRNRSVIIGMAAYFIVLTLYTSDQ